MQVIADLLDIHPVEVHSVVSFYSFLDERPQGQFVIRLCRTITCDMAGKDHVARQLENDLGIEFGETTPDGKFSLEWANCLGMCDQGPAMLVNEQDLHPGHAREGPRHPARSAGRRSASTPMADAKGAPTMTIATTNGVSDVRRRSSPAPGCARPWPGRRPTCSARIDASGLRGPRRRRLPDQPEMGTGRRSPTATRSTSSATPTRASRARSRTA